MIQYANTRFTRATAEPMAAGLVLREEGIPLDYIKVEGQRVVNTANGGMFAGIAIAKAYPPASLPMVEEFVIPADGTVELGRVPTTALLVKINGVIATAGAGVGKYQFTAATNVATFDAADIGKKCVVQYAYAPSVEEARMLVGDEPYGGQAANIAGVVSCLKHADEVATSFFDASKDWTNVLYVATENGKFIPAADAATGIAGVSVKNAPNVGCPFLVLSLNVAV